MKKYVLVVADASSLISLWVANRLDLLLRLNMPIVVVDGVYEEITSDTRYQQAAEIKEFIESYTPPFAIEETEIGSLARERKENGPRPIKHVGKFAIMEFISEEGGIQRYLTAGNPVLVLADDNKLRVWSKPENMHLMSTVGLLREMERSGLLSPADNVYTQ